MIAHQMVSQSLPLTDSKLASNEGRGQQGQTGYKAPRIQTIGPAERLLQGVWESGKPDHTNSWCHWP